MPIEPVKIPQNVYIEDRIVGPLTLRQIIIMALGGGFSYMLYATVQKSYGTMNIPLTILLWTPAAISAAFALIKINDLSLMRICFLLLERLNKPALRTFAPRQGISITIRTSKMPEPEKKKVEEKKEEDNHDKIRELSSLMDRKNIATMPTPTEAPVIADDSPIAISEPRVPSSDIAPPTPQQPVNPARVKVDTPELNAPDLSDLSVFRDILPPQTPWH